MNSQTDDTGVLFRHRMNSRKRKYKDCGAFVCVSVRVSEESISTIARMGRDREGGNDAENLQPQRKNQGRLIQHRAEDLTGSIIELRILDSTASGRVSEDVCQ